MKLKNKIGCSTNSYHEFGLEAALKGIAAAGFEYVELTAVKDYTEHVKPECMDKKDIENVLALLRQQRQGALPEEAGRGFHLKAYLGAVQRRFALRWRGTSRRHRVPPGVRRHDV